MKYVFDTSTVICTVNMVLFDKTSVSHLSTVFTVLLTCPLVMQHTSLLSVFFFTSFIRSETCNQNISKTNMVMLITNLLFQSLTRCVKCFEKRPQTLFSVYPDTYCSRSKDRICWTAFLLKAWGAKFSLLWQGEGMKGRILYLYTCGTLGQSSKMKGYSCSEVTRWDAIVILIADLCWLLTLNKTKE